MGALPVPTRKSERWKYSPITAMLARPVGTAKALKVGLPTCSPTRFLGWTPTALSWSTGTWCPRRATCRGRRVVCMPWCQAVEEGHLADLDWSGYHRREWVGAVHAAHAQDGMFLHVAQGVTLDRPVLVHHHTTGDQVAACPRHRIVVEDQAHAEVVLWHSASNGATGMVNGVLEARVGAGARLGLDKVQHEEGRCSIWPTSM